MYEDYLAEFEKLIEITSYRLLTDNEKERMADCESYLNSHL